MAAGIAAVRPRGAHGLGNLAATPLGAGSLFGIGPRLIAPLLPALVAALLLAGCVPLTSAPTSVPAPASLAPAPAAVAETASALEAAYRAAGFGFIRAQQPYRPSEPPELQSVPRTVYQIVLPSDPGAGYVVIYQATDASGAQTMASDLLRYVQSGFGQTNFPTDAQFAISIYGPTVVFGWYSPGASADPPTAARALGVLRSFGQPVPVVR